MPVSYLPLATTPLVDNYVCVCVDVYVRSCPEKIPQSGGGGGLSSADIFGQERRGSLNVDAGTFCRISLRIFRN